MPCPDDGRYGGVNTDLLRLVAAAADLCRKPLRHAVVPLDPELDPLPAASGDGLAGRELDCSLRIEARTPAGERCDWEDLELEIYRSGEDLHLTLAWARDESRPMLWQGSHSVWMDGASGSRCPGPGDGAPLEALARRLRALLSPS